MTEISIACSTKYIKICESYNDKAFVFSTLCTQTSRHYNTLKYCFQVPLIITSTVLSIFNSNVDTDMGNSLKIVNPIFNILTALLLSINNAFRFESKSDQFKHHAIKFQKLSSLIESKMVEGDITKDFITVVINTYDGITEGINDDIPSHICARVHKLYAGKKHLPILINGVKKELIEDHFVINVSDESPKTSPRVLETKPHKGDYIARLQA